MKYFHIPSVNCIPTLSPETTQQLASGPYAVPDAPLSIKKTKQEQSLCRLGTSHSSDPDTPHLTGTAWDLSNGYPTYRVYVTVLILTE